MNDYPIHQISEPIRHVGTSDRNFYDRYYFNCHGSSDELFRVMGTGQYPNLAVHDALAVVRRGGRHSVVRASRELFVTVSTGYGREKDWRHGMYQGPLVVQGREWSMKELSTCRSPGTPLDRARRRSARSCRSRGVVLDRESDVVLEHGSARAR